MTSCFERWVTKIQLRGKTAEGISRLVDVSPGMLSYLARKFSVPSLTRYYVKYLSSVFPLPDFKGCYDECFEITIHFNYPCPLYFFLINYTYLSFCRRQCVNYNRNLKNMLFLLLPFIFVAS